MSKCIGVPWAHTECDRQTVAGSDYCYECLMAKLAKDREHQVPIFTPPVCRSCSAMGWILGTLEGESEHYEIGPSLLRKLSGLIERAMDGKLT